MLSFSEGTRHWSEYGRISLSFIYFDQCLFFNLCLCTIYSFWFFVTIGLSDRGLVCMSLKSGVGRLAYSHNDCATMALAYLEGSRELGSKFLWLGWWILGRIQSTSSHHCYFLVSLKWYNVPLAQRDTKSTSTSHGNAAGLFWPGSGDFTQPLVLLCYKYLLS